MADRPSNAEIIAYLEEKLNRNIDSVELTAGGHSVTISA